MTTLKQIETIGREYEGIIRSAGYGLPKNITYELIRKHSRQRFGACWYWGDPDRITISINRDLATDEGLRNTIAHELVHALYKCKGHHHDKVWKEYAQFIVVDLLGLSYGATRTSQALLDVEPKIHVRFQMTPKGVSLQNKRSVYKDLTKTYDFKSAEHYEKTYIKLQEKGVIKSLKIGD